MKQRTYKGLRADLDKTQEELAEALGVSRAVYQRYEKYEVPMPGYIVVKLADLCGITDIRSIKLN